MICWTYKHKVNFIFNAISTKKDKPRVAISSSMLKVTKVQSYCSIGEESHETKCEVQNSTRCAFW